MTRDKVLPDAVMANWDAVVEQADALSEEYLEKGWDVTVVHPGDVTPIFGDTFGLDVLAPGDEYEQIQDLVDQYGFDRSHVYRDMSGNIALFVTVYEDTTEEVAVVVPTYVALADLDRLIDQARSKDYFPTHVRPLSDDSRATFRVEDPKLYVPE